MKKKGHVLKDRGRKSGLSLYHCPAQDVSNSTSSDGNVGGKSTTIKRRPEPLKITGVKDDGPWDVQTTGRANLSSKDHPSSQGGDRFPVK